MLQMNKSVSPRPSLSALAGVLIPVSVIAAMGVGLVIGLSALMGNISYATSAKLPETAAYVREEAPDVSEQIIWR